MKIPNSVNVSTKEFLQIQNKLILYISLFGCKNVDTYLDIIPLRMRKKESKLLGAYIENKICYEYKITRYELYESSERQSITEARQLTCVLIEKYLKLNKTEISLLFNRSRHFAKRMIGVFNEKLEENHPFDKKLIERFRRMDALIGTYVDFKPLKTEES